LRWYVKGVCVPGLDPVKVMLYADDINLFLREADSIQEISTCLTKVAYTIGSKFNMEKTDIKPVGPHMFKVRCYNEQNMAGHMIPGACFLPPTDPLRILGVWIGSRFTTHRWTQIDVHIKLIILQCMVSNWS